MANKERKEVSEKTLTLISSLLSIVGGLLVSFLFLYILEWTKAESNFGLPSSVYWNFMVYGVDTLSALIKVFYNAAPLIMCGLAVGFAFKAGLFNIGIVGQYTVGAFFALIAVLLWGWPWWAGMIMAMIAGAFWGAIPGFFKAKFNINEVITTIMLNWTALYFTNFLLWSLPNIRTQFPYNRTDKISYVNISGLLPDLGLQDLTGSDYANIGIFIAIIIAVIMHIVLNKTTFGYEVKACGSNRHASDYAGIKAKKTIIQTFIISGALAGIGGAISYLAGTIQFNAYTELLSLGFNGIPVALLAMSNPLGTILSGIFIAYLQVGGQAFEGVYSSEVTGIILSVIIYFSAFTLIISQFIRKYRVRQQNKEDNGEEIKFAKLLDVGKNLFNNDKKSDVNKSEIVDKDDEEVSK
ncbi:MAG: ABC transporter permease [Sphaerochaetaceae bacterium]|nr:ABC transporter permease [Sphaerochaetaceae bacterium]